MQKKRFSLPKFCLDARKSNSPFDVRCPLFGGQWQDMYFNTQNRDTYPIWSQGSSSHVAKHIPHSASPFPGQLSALRRQTRGSIPRDPTCPFQSSHCRHPKPSAHQPLEQMIFCLILGFKQDSYNCLQPPMSRGYSMHSHGTAHHRGTFIASGPHEPEAVQIFGVSGQVYSHAWQSGSGQRLWNGGVTRNVTFCGISAILWHTYLLWVGEQNVFSSLSHSLPFWFRVQHGKRKNPHLRPG